MVEAAEPAVGRTRAVEILCGGRSKVVEKYSYDGLPTYGTSPTCAATTCLRASTSCSLTAACARPAGASRSWRRRERVPPRRPRLRHRLEPPGDSRHAPRRLGGRRRRGGRVRQAGCAALERAQEAGVPTATFPTGDFADRATRDAALADWVAGNDVQLVVLAGYMQLLTPAFLGLLPARGGQRASGAVAGLPRPRRRRAGARAWSQGLRRHGSLRRRGRRYGPDLLQRALELPHARTREDVFEQLHAVEHELLPEAIRLIARGAVRIDPADPRRVLLEP